MVTQHGWAPRDTRPCRSPVPLLVYLDCDTDNLICSTENKISIYLNNLPEGPESSHLWRLQKVNQCNMVTHTMALGIWHLTQTIVLFQFAEPYIFRSRCMPIKTIVKNNIMTVFPDTFKTESCALTNEILPNI